MKLSTCAKQEIVSREKIIGKKRNPNVERNAKEKNNFDTGGEGGGREVDLENKQPSQSIICRY